MDDELETVTNYKRYNPNALMQNECVQIGYQRDDLRVIDTNYDPDGYLKVSIEDTAHNVRYGNDKYNVVARARTLAKRALPRGTRIVKAPILYKTDTLYGTRIYTFTLVTAPHIP